MAVKRFVNYLIGVSILANCLVVILVVSSCGGRNGDGYNGGGDGYGSGDGTGNSDGSGDDQGFAEIKTVIDANCGKCHDGTNQKPFNTEARFRSSKALARIENGTMPPSGNLNADAKSKLVAYLKDK